MHPVEALGSILETPLKVRRDDDSLQRTRYRIDSWRAMQGANSYVRGLFVKKCIALVMVLSLLAFVVTSEAYAASTSKKVTLKLANGTVYYGEVKNGQPNGKGTMNWGRDKVYSGSWVNGKRSGYGQYKFIDYSDAYKDDNGELVNINTYTYKGMWLNDRQDGEGTYTEENYGYNNFLQMNFSTRKIKKGKFLDGKFTKGYVLSSSPKSSTYTYIDDKQTIVIGGGYESIGEMISSKFKSGFDMDFVELSYYKNTKNNLYSGYHYYRGNGGPIIEEGVFLKSEGDYGDNYSIYSGTSRHNDSETKYVNGIEISSKEIYGDTSDLLNKKIDKNKSIIDPYIKGFLNITEP